MDRNSIWNELIAGRAVENNSPSAGRPGGAVSKWESYRRACPDLELNHVSGDDLSLLSVRLDRPEVSLAAYLAVQRGFSANDGHIAAKELLMLFKTTPFVFINSGWVPKAVARIVLWHHDAAKEFLKAYWRERNKRPPEKELRALDALEVVAGEHSLHWIRAVRFFLRVWRTYDRKRAESRFVLDAVQQYLGEKRPCECLGVEALFAIAQEVFTNSEEKVHVLKDRALARYKDTSHSMLTHLRARLRFKEHSERPRRKKKSR